MRDPARLLAIVGATGTGKTELSLLLADRIRERGGRAEIVNADAMQLYRGMDIGTAKLPVERRRGIPHHLLDVLEVTEDASVARYQSEARRIIDGILARDHVPILVGGSGLYVSAVLYDFRFPPHDAALRRALEDEAARCGTAALMARLHAEDPEVARRLDPANTRRVVRALEAVLLARRQGPTADGEPAGGASPPIATGHARDLQALEPRMSSGGPGYRYQAALPERPALWCPGTLVLGLRVERPRLVAALDERVTGMWRGGLVEEVERLRGRGLDGAGTAARAIGYGQALAYLHGSLSRDEAIARTQTLTRRYARRQVGWFRRYPDVRWMEGGPGRPDPGAQAARLAGW